MKTELIIYTIVWLLTSTIMYFSVLTPIWLSLILGALLALIGRSILFFLDI